VCFPAGSVWTGFGWMDQHPQGDFVVWKVVVLRTGSASAEQWEETRDLVAKKIQPQWNVLCNSMEVVGVGQEAVILAEWEEKMKPQDPKPEYPKPVRFHEGDFDVIRRKMEQVRSWHKCNARRWRRKCGTRRCTRLC
jgi:hypothetical protein